MIRELFHIGSFSISPFGVTLVLAFVAAYLQLRWGMRRLGAGDEEDASALVLWAGIGGITGSKVYYAILNGDWRLLFDRSGLVWYGGFVLGLTAVVVTMVVRRLPAWTVLDASSLGLALGYAVGRLGCFLVGDDYGVPTSLPWGIKFKFGLPPTYAGDLRQSFGLAIPESIADDTLLAVHPTQIYETLAALAIWGLGLWLLKHRRFPGATALLVFALLATERFLVEFLRAKDDRFFDPLTLAQAISIAVFVVSLSLWWWRRRRAVPPGQ
jgi:phosphatidylglycerol:prolipoprotein diacylglycerol transferase